ncbi:MAG: DUF3048 domain-containing protein [Anaerolineales bacterium]|nr:DUF3048 domain-containing protein [Anaerolineales bacterium]
MAKTFQKTIQLILFFMMVMGLVACGGADNSSPVNAAAVDSPTAVAVVETAVPAATATLPPPVVPTNTLPPPAVVDNEPTATVPPVPTATPEPVALYSKADFGTDRNPLTGELMADPSVLQRRPIAIKISNNPPQFTRPQHGICQADLVF